MALTREKILRGISTVLFLMAALFLVPGIPSIFIEGGARMAAFVIGIGSILASAIVGVRTTHMRHRTAVVLTLGYVAAMALAYLRPTL